MKNKPGKSKYWMVPGFIGFMLIVLIYFFFSLIDQTIEEYSYLNLLRSATENRADLSVRIKKLEDENGSLAKRLSERRSLTYPTLSELNKLASSHRLRIAKIEAIGNINSSEDSTRSIRLVLKGKIGAQVRFLKTLESKYFFKMNALRITPADINGNETLLKLQLKLGTGL